MDWNLSNFTIPLSESELASGAVGVGATLLLIAAWNYAKKGKGTWEKRMSERQREREDVALVTDHIAGALQYMLKDKLISPERLWKVLHKLDGLPTLRTKMLPIFKPLMPEKQQEEAPPLKSEHKLRLLRIVRP